MKKWNVELRRTQTRTLIVEAPDPAARDAIAYGVMKQMDEGTKLSPSVTVVDSMMSDWERGNTGEIRPQPTRVTHIGINSGINPNHFQVPSIDGSRYYDVDLSGPTPRCSCANWAITTNKMKSNGDQNPVYNCKHITAVMEAL